ncbi:MAG: hypothetical protein V3T30_09280 [Thermodesulfobacteriota bacterium]
MKTIKLFTAILTVVLSLSLFSVKAEAVDVSGSASADFYDNYVWRGLKLSDDHGVIQPDVSIGYQGFGAGMWGNYDMDSGIWNETDLTLSYAHSFKGLTAEAGYIHYALDGLLDTHEAYFGLSYDTYLSPAVTYYYDMRLGKGGFLVASIGHSHEIYNGITINGGASASANFKNDVMQIDGPDADTMPDDFSGFYNGDVSLSITIPVPIPGFPGIAIEPRVAYSFPLSTDAEMAIEGLSVDPHGAGEIVYGGIGASISF